MLTALLVVYGVGVVVGLFRVDADLITRVVVALLWPAGIAAGMLTVGALVVAAMVLFPVLGMAVVVAVGIWSVVGGWW